MRLQKEMIERISAKVVDRLVRREIITCLGSEEALCTRIAHIIEEDLLVEDRLN